MSYDDDQDLISGLVRENHRLNNLVGEIDKDRVIQHRHVNAVADILYNISPLGIVLLTLKEGHPNWSSLHPNYVQEHLDRFERGFGSWWGRLDRGNQDNFVRLLNEYVRKGVEYRTAMMEYSEVWDKKEGGGDEE